MRKFALEITNRVLVEGTYLSKWLKFSCSALLLSDTISFVFRLALGCNWIPDRSKSLDYNNTPGLQSQQSMADVCCCQLSNWQLTPAVRFRCCSIAKPPEHVGKSVWPNVQTGQAVLQQRGNSWASPSLLEFFQKVLTFEIWMSLKRIRCWNCDQTTFFNVFLTALKDLIQFLVFLSKNGMTFKISNMFSFCSDWMNERKN